MGLGFRLRLVANFFHDARAHLVILVGVIGGGAEVHWGGDKPVTRKGRGARIPDDQKRDH